MITIARFAHEYGLRPDIDRAISFAPEQLSQLYTIPVEYSHRLKTSAGYTHFHGNSISISLHPGLLREGFNAITNTFLHEVAHVMEWMIYRRQPRFRMAHGYNWSEQMIRLGLVPQRTHNYASCKQRIEAPDPISEIQL